jgi:hypothetical protein
MKFRVKGTLQVTIDIDKEVEAETEDSAYSQVMGIFDPVNSDITVSRKAEGYPRVRIQTRTEIKE